MAKARVLMLSTTETYVTVEVADDVPEDERDEKAIELAYKHMPTDLCHQCAGFRKLWSRELGEAEVPEVGLWPPAVVTLTADQIVNWDE